MMKITKTVIASAMSLSMFSAVHAQEATVQPSSVVESYDNWTLACDRVEVAVPKAEEGKKKEDGKKDEKKDDKAAKNTETKTVCDVYQSFSNPRSKKEVGRFYFAYVTEEGKAPELRAGMRILVDVSFDKKPIVTDGDNTILEGKISRCAGNFCYIEFEIDEAKTKLLEQAEKPRFAYPLSSERMIRVDMSSKGLEGALKSLKEKQKAN